MFNRPLRSRLIALRPISHQPVVEEVQQSQWREFRPGQTVLARDYRKGAAKWTQAKVEKRLGTLLYLVKAGDTTVKRHVDQLLPLQGAREREEDDKPEIFKSIFHFVWLIQFVCVYVCLGCRGPSKG